MKEILSHAQMKECDTRTINEHKVPSLLLMERAAFGVVEAIDQEYPENNRFVVVCGPGNNGGDGVAIARLLHIKGMNARCFVLGNPDKYTEQLHQEIDIAESYGMAIENSFDEAAIEQDTLVVDAMFGIGLTRGLSGDFEHIANIINKNASKVVAVDIPSGFDADCGKCLGSTGVKADLTVTFAYMKKGLVLGDCKIAAGKIVTADVGIYLEKTTDQYETIVEDDILGLIQPRPADANKGTCGKLLVIAGSENIYGACYLSTKAALSTGTGLVKIYTHHNNIASIQQALPEAMYLGYESYNREELSAQLKWADTILIGPGLGTNDISMSIMRQTLEEAAVPIVIDADGLNIVAKQEINPLFKETAKRLPVVITPHLKEMERLTGIPVKEINYDMENVARQFADENGCIVVLKKHTTIVSDGKASMYVISGNEALATPGSGDVLAGVIASLVVQKVNESILTEVAAATYIHGVSGTRASQKYGTRGVLASHIIEEFTVL